MSKLITSSNLYAYHTELAEHIKLLQRGITYSLNNIVNYDGKTLKCTTAGTTAITKPNVLALDVGDTYTDGTCVWTIIDPDKRGIDYWASSTTYALNDQVVNDNKIYKCTTAHTSTSTFDSTKWTEISAGGGGSIDEWTSGTSYSSGDLVINNNVLYKANTTTSTTWVDSEWNIIGTSFNTTSTYAQKIVTNVVAPYEMLLQVGDSNYCKPPIDVLKKTGGSDNVTLTLEDYNNASAYTGTSDFLKIENSKAKLYNYKEYPITTQMLSTIDIGVSDEIDFDNFFDVGTSLNYLIRLRADSTGIQDLSENTWTNQNVTYNENGKFGGRSLVFSANNDSWLTKSNSFSFTENEDFTISYWANSLSMVNAGNIVVRRAIEMSASYLYNNSYWSCPYLANANDSSIYYLYYSSRLNGWHHYALTRANGYVRYFIDGVVADGANFAYPIGNNINTPTYIGNMSGLTGRSFDGYMDDICIIKGIALWTSDFTPPTDYLPDKWYGKSYNITSLEVN